MKKNQLTRGETKRLMYVENKEGTLYGADARIGWVTFSKTGKTVNYRDKVLKRTADGGSSGKHYDDATGEEYWVSGIKKRGSNSHWAEGGSVAIDDDALEEYERVKAGK